MALSSSLNSNNQRMQQVNEFVEHTQQQSSKIKKIQESVASLQDLSTKEQRHIQESVEQNQSIVDDSCLALETQLANSTHGLENVISSALAATTPTITSNSQSATMDEQHAATQDSPILDIKIESNNTPSLLQSSSMSSPVAPTTLENPKSVKQALEIRKPALNDISNRQVKRKLTLDKNSQEKKTLLPQPPNKKRNTLQSRLL
ncbi:hypothetical protein BC941DRAFT_467407 [Chlamydoabsidia padenii]|nr:hypothetical protein BC941DRAFT_467407 [Chlamydoabsidia padenii]